MARVKHALAVLADNAAAEIADEDVREYVVVCVADEVVVDLMGRACGISSACMPSCGMSRSRNDWTKLILQAWLSASLRERKLGGKPPRSQSRRQLASPASSNPNPDMST